MYSNIKSVQIVVALMKEFQIRDVVLSPGGSDIPLIHSIEMDSFFKCYSVVDERSAAYFALGLAQQLGRPVACICTSGTAVCNYVPGITEAFYQNAPVLAITADKNPYYQDQLEVQKIKQYKIFNNVVKKSVELPIVNSSEDEWLCNRLVNEALLELNHRGSGPCHINIPIVGATHIYDCKDLPKQRKINIHNLVSDSFASRLNNKNIMVIVGQNVNFEKKDIENMNKFFEKFNCFYAVENLSNLDCDGVVNTYPISEMHSVGSLDHLKPDIVISIGNNLSAYLLKPFLRSHYKRIENWLISESGLVRDPYKCLTDIIEMSPSKFFKSINELSVDNVKENSYYECWKKEFDKLELPKLEFSNFYVAKSLSKIIPEDSIIHTAILNSTRIMQFFRLNKGIKMYSNVGTLGIDGCFSTFAGQAAAAPDKLAYLVIGDLSFFYDMNAAGLSSIGPNVRVILLNNGGGSEFQFFMGKRNIPEIDKYICAEHNKVATGWAISLGYDYYSVSTKQEFDNVIEKFGKVSQKPLFLEVFGEMEIEADRTNAIYDIYRKNDLTSTSKIKKVIKDMVSEKQINKVKKIVQILKEK